MMTVFWIVGVLNLANGLWMLLAPGHWYLHLPAGVPDTGPLNEHFVRDIGAAFTTFGLGFCWVAARPSRRFVVAALAASFFGLHAVVHVADLFTGRLHHGHWLIDLPGVFVPALIAIALC